MIPNFKKPDLNAPRYRRSRCSMVNDDFMKEFYSKYPKYEGKSSTKEVNKVLSTFNTLLWKDVIKTRDGVELPEGLGIIFVGTCQPPKKYNPDYNLSKELCSRVRHRNFESDNYLCKIFYSNFANKYRFSFRELWAFNAFRDFSRETSDEYPKNWKMYLQVENHIFINKQYNEHFKKAFIEKRKAKVSEIYNEFDLD